MFPPVCKYNYNSTRNYDEHLMNLCIKGAMYDFFVININWICVARLLKWG
jgi:hypothetical protein